MLAAEQEVYHGGTGLASSSPPMAEAVTARGGSPTTSKPAKGFYQRVLRAFVRHEVPCLLGGTYALERHTGIRRMTRDLDLFVERRHWDRIVEALDSEGIPAELTYPHWLGKAGTRRRFVDLLFASANGLCRVSEDWFPHAASTRIWGIRALVCPVEELIWSKSFVMERERFDGADVLHLIRARGHVLDWDRLLARYGEHWQVLLAHLVLFDFVFPGEPGCVPPSVMTRLLDRARAGAGAPDPERLCRGTLLSREQYLVDIEQRGDVDARLLPPGELHPADLAQWTAEVPAARRAVLVNETRRRAKAS